MTGKISFVTVPDAIFDEFPNAKIAGYYGPFGQPNFVINDFQLVKNILVKDFDYFSETKDYMSSAHPDTNKYARSLLSVMQGDKWKKGRNLLTPIFTGRG